MSRSTATFVRAVDGRATRASRPKSPMAEAAIPPVARPCTSSTIWATQAMTSSASPIQPTTRSSAPAHTSRPPSTTSSSSHARVPSMVSQAAKKLHTNSTRLRRIGWKAFTAQSAHQAPNASRSQDMAPLCPRPTRTTTPGSGGRRRAPGGQDCDRAAVVRSRCGVPLPRDTHDAHARVLRRGAGSGHHARAVLVRGSAWPRRVTGAGHPPVLPGPEGDAAPRAPPGVDRRRRLRHRPARAPGPARDDRTTGRPPRPRPPRRSHRLGAPRSLPASVGPHRRRAPRGRQDRPGGQGAPQRHGRDRRARDPRVAVRPRTPTAGDLGSGPDRDRSAGSGRPRPTPICSRRRPASACARPRASVGSSAGPVRPCPRSPADARSRRCPRPAPRSPHRQPRSTARSTPPASWPSPGCRWPA